MVGAQLALDRETVASRSARLDLLRSQAAREGVELVVHGVVAGEPRGFVYRRLEKVYQSDRQAERLTEEELVRILEQGATLTWTAVYQGGGDRIGIDRDQDGVFNADETDLGSDPSDTHDMPRSHLRGDCDGDGATGLVDAVFLLEFLFRSGVEPDCAEACNVNGDRGARGSHVNVVDAVAVLSFLFRGGPPPGSFPECETTGNCAVATCN